MKKFIAMISLLCLSEFAQAESCYQISANSQNFSRSPSGYCLAKIAGEEDQYKVSKFAFLQPSKELGIFTETTDRHSKFYVSKQTILQITPSNTVEGWEQGELTVYVGRRIAKFFYRLPPARD